ncbi:MAG: response regulator [Chloroflexota bacterium]|nr:MAG: response regulator [Chloroflexota bacterium]
MDDDEAIRDFVDWALTAEGYVVATAPNGAAALALLEHQRPDVILLDVRMPVMDGWSFVRAYRELSKPHAPIILLSAARDGQNPASDIGAAAVLPKPFDLVELLTLVERLAPGTLG